MVLLMSLSEIEFPDSPGFPDSLGCFDSLECADSLMCHDSLKGPTIQVHCNATVFLNSVEQVQLKHHYNCHFCHSSAKKQPI